MKAHELIPREHGAWAMWIVPMLSSALVTRFSAAFAVLFISFTLLYVVHHPAVTMLKRRSVPQRRDVLLLLALAVPGLLAGTGIVFLANLPWLLVFAAIEGILFAFSIRSFLARDQRSFVSELVTVAALTLTAPAGYYTITGSLDEKALLLYSLNILFFGSSVFYVKLKIESIRSKGGWSGEAGKALAMMIVYHSVLVAVLAAAALYGVINPWLLAAFVPVVLQVILGALSHEQKVSFTRLGVVLVFQSLLFLAVIGVFLR